MAMQLSAVQMRIVLLGITLTAVTIGYALTQQTEILIYLSETIRALVASGQAVAAQLYTTVVANAQVVAKAIDDAISDAARATQRIIRELKKLKPFPVVRRFMPTIYAFNVRMLTANPALHLLTYNGPWSTRTVANRAWVKSIYGCLMATAPAWPPHQLDEFPFASTKKVESRWHRVVRFQQRRIWCKEAC